MISETDLAPSITKAASKQSYFTIRLLADRDRLADAYRAYAYFRWVDDMLDGGTSLDVERSVFIKRQSSILEGGYRGEAPRGTDIHEAMLVELIRNDRDKNSGLQTYLRHMMAVMAFDAGRRGRLVSQTELNEYTRLLATAVTEALHHFIGHGCYAPQNEARNLAVTAAHITHMLRDTFEDLHSGYFNIPREVLESNHITPFDVQSEAFCAWVRSRIQLARQYFEAGRDHLRQVENARCRLAGFAYTARFEWLLDTIEREEYRLRPHYNERRSFGTGLRMGWDTLLFITRPRGISMSPQTLPVRKNY